MRSFNRDEKNQNNTTMCNLMLYIPDTYSSIIVPKALLVKGMVPNGEKALFVKDEAQVHRICDVPIFV